MFFEASEDEQKFIDIATSLESALTQSTAEQLVKLISQIHSDEVNNNRQLYEDLTKLIENEVREQGIN